MDKKSLLPNNGDDRKVVMCNIAIQIGSEQMKSSKQLADALHHLASLIETDSTVEYEGSLVEHKQVKENGGIINRPIRDDIGRVVGTLSFIEE